MQNKQKKLAKQVGKFGIVGILNTLIDIIILNILIKISLSLEFFFLGYKVVGANMISVSVAMVNSYILNKYWTFESKEKKNIAYEIFKFLFVTVIGMFVIHQIAFNLFYTYWSGPADLVVGISHFIGLNRIFSDSFVVLNFAKVIAILFSLVWNFVGYKIWVFKK